MNPVWDPTGIEAEIRVSRDEMTAKGWDEFLRRFGVEVYVTARYISASLAEPIHNKKDGGSSQHNEAD
jgi:hypothetical protein